MSFLRLESVREDKQYFFDTYISESLAFWFKADDILKIFSMKDLEKLPDILKMITQVQPPHTYKWKQLHLKYLLSSFPTYKELSIEQRISMKECDPDVIFINEFGVHRIFSELYKLYDSDDLKSFADLKTLEAWFVKELTYKTQQTETYSAMKATLQFLTVKEQITKIIADDEKKANQTIFYTQFTQAREQYLKALSSQVEAMNKQQLILKEFLKTKPELDTKFWNTIFFTSNDCQKLRYLDGVDIDEMEYALSLCTQKLKKIIKPNVPNAPNMFKFDEFNIPDESDISSESNESNESSESSELKTSDDSGINF
ncbi:hypothetical protein DLEV_108 [Diachasmimorpha longicaudata entomopoxvirus]|uniref:Uncharacterized protein n=1 Tax=Diachasmimorpha longicaudata entomopoxvirus TaxID=109981 RepID=A0A7R5WM51_9POXV|nr:hypothetical protein QKK69_gp108 [Diachasmimorpha longicaudata entomopoxvirus]AKS26399.1 hypothetical protein DLEV_108 [Diachasmimorpha longicaudata entomopoxvirus]